MSKAFTLPTGTLVWPKLNEIDVFKPKNGKEKRRFITNIKFSDEDHRKVDAYLKKIMAAGGQPNGQLPWKKDKKTGELTLQATSGEKYPPALLDAKGNELPRAKFQVGGGTIAKVNVTTNVYDGFGGGLNLYLNFVQITDFKAKQRFQVEAEDGFTYTGDDDEGPADTSAPEAPDTDMDDDIPF